MPKRESPQGRYLPLTEGLRKEFSLNLYYKEVVTSSLALGYCLVLQYNRLGERETPRLQIIRASWPNWHWLRGNNMIIINSTERALS